jgi:hypothetical protein
MRFAPCKSPLGSPTEKKIFMLAIYPLERLQKDLAESVLQNMQRGEIAASRGEGEHVFPQAKAKSVANKNHQDSRSSRDILE